MNESGTGGDGASVNRASPQPTVLVTGPAGRLSMSVALRLLAARVDPADGGVLVVSDTSPARLIEQLTAEPLGLDRDALVVVDCRRTDDGEEPDAGRVRQVRNDESSRAVDREVRDGLDWLAARGIERRHFLIDSLAPGTGLPDSGAVYELAYELAMIVGTENGLGAFAVESAGLSTGDVRRLGHLFDVRVELKRGEVGPELRWTGLLGDPEDWLPVRQVDFEAADLR